MEYLKSRVDKLRVQQELRGRVYKGLPRNEYTPPASADIAEGVVVPGQVIETPGDSKL